MELGYKGSTSTTDDTVNPLFYYFLTDITAVKKKNSKKKKKLEINIRLNTNSFSLPFPFPFLFFSSSFFSSPRFCIQVNVIFTGPFFSLTHFMPPLPDTHCTPLASLWGNNQDTFLQQKQHDITAAKFAAVSPVVVIPGSGLSRSNSAVYTMMGSPPASPPSEPDEDLQRRRFSSTPNSITTNHTQHLTNYQSIHHQSSFSSSGSPPPLSRSTTANSVFSTGSGSASGGSGIWSPSVFSASSHYDNQQHQQQQRLFQQQQQQQQQQKQHQQQQQKQHQQQQEQQRQQHQQQQLPSYNDCQFFNIDPDSGAAKDYPVRWATPLEQQQQPQPSQQPQHYGLPMQQQQQHNNHQYMNFNEYPGGTPPYDFPTSANAGYVDRRVSSLTKQTRKSSDPLMGTMSPGTLPSPPSSAQQAQQQAQLQQQQQQNQQNQQNQQQGRLIVNSELYKTELCATFIRYGSCPYGKKCQFAHGDHDLKAVDRPPKWRSKPCQNWLRTGTCAYNERCCFRHDAVKPQ